MPATEDLRFGPQTSTSYIKEKEASLMPTGTLKRDKWAVNLFNGWRNFRVKHVSEEEKEMADALEKPMSELSMNELNFWLSKFIFEARKKDGTYYPGDSLVSIISGLQRSLSADDKIVNFFKDNNFKKIYNALDAAMKSIAQHGRGLFKRHAEVISVDEEQKIWNSGVLGVESP